MLKILIVSPSVITGIPDISLANIFELRINNIDGEEFKSKYGFNCPVGVKGRNSDNKLFEEKMKWKTTFTLKEGMIKTYNWINEQIQN
mgnify:CR=1 FL=1